MKQFEKWWHNPKNEKINKLSEEDAPVQDWTEAGYRRALEWVKREVISSDERGDISRGVINRELEEG